MDDPRLMPGQVPAPDGAAEQGRCRPVSRPDTAGALAAALLAAALWWAAARGLWVFPCEVGGKRPVVAHGFKDATRDPVVIRGWWENEYAGHNIGARTGYPGPDVLDVDVRAGGSGWPAFNRLKAAGLLTGAHRLVRTPSAGAHLYFAGTEQRCGSLKSEHLDLKARGGYILVPPSRVDGRPYEIVDDRAPTGATLDWEAVKRLLVPPRPYRPRPTRGYRTGPGSATHLVSWLEGEFEGNRNNGLFWACCRALEAGDEAVVGDLADVALSAGLAGAEVRRTVESAYKEVNGDGR